MSAKKILKQMYEDYSDNTVNLGNEPMAEYYLERAEALREALAALEAEGWSARPGGSCGR